MLCVGAHRGRSSDRYYNMRIGVWYISLLLQLNESSHAERAGYALPRGAWEREKQENRAFLAPMLCVGAQRRTVLRPLLCMRIDLWYISLLLQLNESSHAVRGAMRSHAEHGSEISCPVAFPRRAWERDNRVHAVACCFVGGTQAWSSGGALHRPCIVT